MNERIKELLVESGNGQFHDGKFYAHIGPRTNEDWERFAELIVRECAAMCDETKDDYFKLRKATYDFNEKTIYAEGESASDIIKYKMWKRFGVK